ncbi:NUDIX domain-containing protein [Roseovarius indicus]|uniref:NUDIX domain-containing protein n=1 Tax=Roseovarius indicus TaxID=540747 RepID=UPI00351814D2
MVLYLMLRHHENLTQYSGVLLVAEDGELILQFRDDKPGITNPGRVSLFGGTAKRGETPRKAACRELHEETCISVEPGELLLLGVFPYATGTVSSVAFAYVLPNVDPRSINIIEGAGSLKIPADSRDSIKKATPLCRAAMESYVLLHSDNFAMMKEILRDL